MANPAPDRPLVPGAGVDPRKVVRPGKRLRNWHRRHLAIENALPESKRLHPGLKEYVRAAVALGSESSATPSNKDNAALAKRWLASKGVRP